MRDKIRVQLTGLIVLAISVSFCFSQARTPSKRSESVRRAPFLTEAKAYEESPYVTRVVLKNGMTILVNEFKAQPLISIQTYINAGISHESRQNSGIASLLAGMIWRGTPHQSGGTFRQKIQALGGFFGTHVEMQTVQFETVVPSSQWKQALNLQADALLHPVFNKETLKLEAGLIAGEAQGMLEDVSTLANESLLELAYSHAQYGKYGTLAKDSLSSLAPENLADFYKAHYVPAAMTLVISGDVRSADVLNEVAHIFASSTGSVATAGSVPDGTQKEFRYRAMRGNDSFAHLLFGFHISSEKAEDYRTIEVLSALLGMGESSILNMRLRDQKGLAFSTETNLKSFSNSGYFSIGLVSNPQNIDESEIALLTELELIKREGPAEADMERAFAQLERTYWQQLETVSGRAKTLAHFQLLGDWKQMDRYIAALRKVKPADVKLAARRYFQLQNCSLLEFLPASMNERVLSTESVQKTLEGLLDPSTDQEQQERIKEVVLALKIPATADTFKFSEVQYPFQVASILRGPEMLIREDHTSPLIDLGVFFPGGKFQEGRDNSGITELMLRLMLRGSKDQQDGRLLRQIEIYGGKIEPVVADDYFGFHFSIPSRNFEAGFELLQEAIKSPYFAKSEIPRLKALQIYRIRQQKNTDRAIQRIANQALFAGFPYALDSAGTEESLAKITPESLLNWYAERVQNRKPVAIVIGDTKGTSLAALFVRQFSGSRMLDSKIEEGYAKPLEKGVSLEQNREGRNSIVVTEFQAPPADDEDRFAATVLQCYLGAFGRFGQEIRDRLGAAYEISIKYRPRLRGGSIMISARTNPKSEEAVLLQVREEIRHLISDPVPYHDFQAALTAAVGLHSVRNQLRIFQINMLVENILLGRKLEDFQNFTTGLREVKEEDLKDLARRILKMDKAVLLRVHGVN